ncbi:hypothetical protein CCP4SC76_7730006 [Gammaproteobacteria bacterium]
MQRTMPSFQDQLFSGYEQPGYMNSDTKALKSTSVIPDLTRWTAWLNPVEKFAAAPADVPVWEWDVAGRVKGLLISHQPTKDAWQ